MLIFAYYQRSFGIAGEVEHARAMALVTLAFASAMLTIVLGGFSSRIAHAVVVATIVLTLLLVQLPFTAALLHLSPLHLDDLLLSAIGATVVILISLFGRFGREG